jgi:glycosyltransferase involved in cell wall biosynthesis
VFPAPSEDWGLVPLESMACGKPVLAVDRGGPRESVIDGCTGLLRPNHPAAFANAMRTLARMPGEHLESMSHRARKRALQFPWQRFVERMDEHVELLGLLRAAGRGHAGHSPRVTMQPLPVVPEPVGAGAVAGGQ